MCLFNLAYSKKIVLITSGQPSLNPRLVKEADALTDAGYTVTVLYAYWNDWGTLHDQQLLPERKWQAIRIGGEPKEKRLTYFLSRLIHKACKFIVQKTHFYPQFAQFAVARSSYFLIKEAKKHKADLYIGHNLGALPAIVKAARLYNKPCGFDAEDFHRQEVSDDVNSYHFKIAKYIEDKYLPLTGYITAASSLIAERYTVLYNHNVTSILNVFPKTTGGGIINNQNEPLKLFWFSQTIGPNRGLEMVIEAIGLTKKNIELHLLGHPANGYKEHLLQMAAIAGVNSKIYFYEPIKADEIFCLAAQFDIGLASETGFCLNNNITLSNKLFTYIQSGLAVVANNTPAQNALINQYPQTGKKYNNVNELSAILNEYNENRELLHQTKMASFETGQSGLNWENESLEFLKLIKNIISKYE